MPTPWAHVNIEQLVLHITGILFKLDLNHTSDMHMSKEFLNWLKKLRHFDGFDKTTAESIVDRILANPSGCHSKYDLAFFAEGSYRVLLHPSARDDLL